MQLMLLQPHAGAREHHSIHPRGTATMGTISQQAPMKQAAQSGPMLMRAG
jgi:hypothetical protein